MLIRSLTARTQRAFSISQCRNEAKTSNISNYKIIDHAYDAVVVGAGSLIYRYYTLLDLKRIFFSSLGFQTKF